MTLKKISDSFIDDYVDIVSCWSFHNLIYPQCGVLNILLVKLTAFLCVIASHVVINLEFPSSAETHECRGADCSKSKFFSYEFLFK